MPWIIKRVLMATWEGELPRIKHEWPKCPECEEMMGPILGLWHYTESGRDDVYLENVWIWSCGQAHQMPEISKAVELHKKLQASKNG